MTGLYYIRSAAAAICLTVSVAAVAQDRVPVTAQVGYAGLDLASASDQAAFKNRIRRAAAEACPPAGNGLARDMDRARCMREMQRDGDTHLAALIAPSSPQLATVAPAKLPGK